jgi:hypothetical protein
VAAVLVGLTSGPDVAGAGQGTHPVVESGVANTDTGLTPAQEAELDRLVAEVSNALVRVMWDGLRPRAS